MTAAADIRTKFLSCYEDPLITPGFAGDCYPEEAGGEGAVPANVHEAKARFKAVYARRNVCLRALSRLKSGDAERRTLTEQVLFLTEAIDHLEDVYAPIGFVAEPVMDDTMFTRELIFTHARLAWVKGGVRESSFSLYIPISLENADEEEDPDAP
jgi:hypothetical protein